MVNYPKERLRPDRLTWFLFAAVTISSLALYAAFAARDVIFGDSAELTLAAVTNGVAHPPGYPLWITFGHLFSLLPIGPIPYRVNFSAAVYHAATVGIVFWCAYLLTRRPIAALGAAALLAASPLFVTWSLQAEVFSLNDLFATALLLLCLLWFEHGEWRRLAPALGLVLGLGLATHQTLVLCAPFVAWTTWTRRAFLVGGTGVASVIGALALLLGGFAAPYVHTWFASERLLPWTFGEVRSFSDFVDVVLRRNYGTFALVNGPLEGGNLWQRCWVMIQGMGIVAPLSVAGAGVLLWQRRFEKFGLYVCIIAFPVLGFCAVANNDASIDFARILFLRFALMPLVLSAPFVASMFDGLSAIFRTAGLASVAGATATAIACMSLFATIPSIDVTEDHDPRTLVRDAFAAIPIGAVVLVKGDTLTTTTAYFQAVERERPDLLLVFSDLLAGANYRKRLRLNLNVPESARFLDLVAANPARRFYGIGDSDVQGGINEDSQFVAYTCGLASRIVRRGAFVPLASWYAREAFLQSAPGYGDVIAAHERYDGFSANVRSYYANGLLNAGLDAERLSDYVAALLWLERAQSYVHGVPAISHALSRISAEERQVSPIGSVQVRQRFTI